MQTNNAKYLEKHLYRLNDIGNNFGLKINFQITLTQKSV